MSRPFKLYRLQQIDSQLDWTEKRLQEIETALKEDEALRTASSNAQETEEALQSSRKSLRRAEDEVRQQRVKIEQSEAALYGGMVRNPKELQDLEKEVAALKRYLSVLEDRQLEAMLLEEEALSTNRVAADILEEERARFAQQSKELLVEKEKMLKDIDRFEGERQAAVSSISSQDLGVYTKLRSQRHGIAVAKVTEKACSACGSTLNAALLHASRSPDQINHCDTCGRILYAG